VSLVGIDWNDDPMDPGYRNGLGVCRAADVPRYVVTEPLPGMTFLDAWIQCKKEFGTNLATNQFSDPISTTNGPNTLTEDFLRDWQTHHDSTCPDDCVVGDLRSECTGAPDVNGFQDGDGKPDACELECPTCIPANCSRFTPNCCDGAPVPPANPTSPAECPGFEADSEWWQYKEMLQACVEAQGYSGGVNTVGPLTNCWVGQRFFSAVGGAITFRNEIVAAFPADYGFYSSSPWQGSASGIGTPDNNFEHLLTLDGATPTTFYRAPSNFVVSTVDADATLSVEQPGTSLKVVRTGGGPGTVSLSLLSGRNHFGLYRIDIGRVSGTPGGSTVTFTGHLRAGGTVNKQVVVPTDDSLVTVFFDSGSWDTANGSFVSLVTWTESSADGHRFDNVFVVGDTGYGLPGDTSHPPITRAVCDNPEYFRRCDA